MGLKKWDCRLRLVGVGRTRFKGPGLSRIEGRMMGFQGDRSRLRKMFFMCLARGLCNHQTLIRA